MITLKQNITLDHNKKIQNESKNGLLKLHINDQNLTTSNKTLINVYKELPTFYPICVSLAKLSSESIRTLAS